MGNKISKDFILFREERGKWNKLLRKKKKLLLFLDLDETIVSSCDEKQLREAIKKREQKILDRNGTDVLTEEEKEMAQLHPNWQNDEGTYFFLRPAVLKLFSDLKRFFIFVITTAAVKSYARDVIMNVPKDRVPTRVRTLSRAFMVTHEDKFIFFAMVAPVDPSMVCILDDSGEIWHHENNLHAGRVYNHLSYRDTVTIVNGAVKEEHFYLQRVKKNLKYVHSQYYSPTGVKDVGEILFRMRQQVLKGCRVYLLANCPHTWSLVPMMGGESHHGVGNTTTHFVLGSKNAIPPNLKAVKQRHPNLICVTTKWLYRSMECLAKVDEDKFLLDPKDQNYMHVVHFDKDKDM